MYKLAIASSLSLFTEEGMHKGTKSALYDAAFTQIKGETDLGSRKYNVWSKSTTPTFQIVCKTHVDYVTKHFGCKTTIGFYGHPNGTTY